MAAGCACCRLLHHLYITSHAWAKLVFRITQQILEYSKTCWWHVLSITLTGHTVGQQHGVSRIGLRGLNSWLLNGGWLRQGVLESVCV